MSKKRMMTVVLQVNDQAAAEPFLSQLGASFCGKAPIPGVVVTAVSNEDEMTKFEKLYAHCVEEGRWVPEELRP